MVISFVKGTQKAENRKQMAFHPFYVMKFKRKN